MYSDPEGKSLLNYALKKLLKAIEWLVENVGFEKRYSTIDINTGEMSDYGVIGAECGTEIVTSSSVNDKPVVFYLYLPEQWWRFWEAMVGIEISIKNKSSSFSFGLLNSELLVSNEDKSVFLFSGIGKTGAGWSVNETVDKVTISSYTKYFTRPYILVPTIVLMAYLGPVILSAEDKLWEIIEWVRAVYG